MSKPKKETGKKVGRPKKTQTVIHVDPAVKEKDKSVEIKRLPFDKETIKTANKVVEKLIPTLSRDKLMMAAKANGVKNYRVLNKAELSRVIEPGVTKETIDKVVKGAVDRWQAGWGHKGGRVHTIKTKGEQTHGKEKESNAKAEKSNV